MSILRRRKSWSASEVAGLVHTARRLVTLGNAARSRLSETKKYESASVSFTNEGDWRLAGWQIASVTPLSEYSRRFLADDGVTFASDRFSLRDFGKLGTVLIRSLLSSLSPNYVLSIFLHHRLLSFFFYLSLYLTHTLSLSHVYLFLYPSNISIATC